MIIVADESRKREFDTKIKSSAFNEIRNRIEFLEYEALTKMYEYTLEKTGFKTKL